VRGIVIINPSLTPLPHPLQPSVGMPTRVSTSTSSVMAGCLGERRTTVRLTVGGAHCSQPRSARFLEDDEISPHLIVEYPLLDHQVLPATQLLLTSTACEARTVQNPDSLHLHKLPFVSEIPPADAAVLLRRLGIRQHNMVTR
jgi:hypothetical protein